MGERFFRWLAYLIPDRVTYWVGVKLLAAATVTYPTRTPDEISALDVLRALKGGPGRPRG